MGHLEHPRVGARAARRGRRASTRSSSAAARRTSRRGWPGAAPARWASTTPRSSSRPPHGCSASTASTSRCSWATRSTCPTRTQSFDLAISEYGACLWADPYAWVPEAARLLRPGGRLVFLTNGYVLMLCTPDEEGVPAGERMLRPSFGMHRFEWPDDDSVEFHLAHGDWVRLLRENGFEVARPDRAPRSRRRRDDRTRTSSPPTGPGSGPARRSGSRAERG